MFEFFDRPKMLMAELTNLCNLRCQMCGIWEEKPKKTMDVEVLDRVLGARAMGSLGVVALTGGEPFLIHNLIDYFRVARRRRPRAHVNISTNGFYTDRTLEFLEETGARNMSVTISYDGVKSHDAIRGVEGSEEKLLATAEEIRRRFPAVDVALKLTVMSLNHTEITSTARRCREMGVGFRFKTLEKLNCHQSRFPSPIQGPDYDATMVRSIAAQAREVLDMRMDANNDYITDLVRLYDGGKVGCSCSVRTLFLGFNGEVFLCRKKEAIGNVLERGFDEIWASEAKRVRAREMKVCAGATETLGFRNG